MLCGAIRHKAQHDFLHELAFTFKVGAGEVQRQCCLVQNCLWGQVAACLVEAVGILDKGRDARELADAVPRDRESQHPQVGFHRKHRQPRRDHGYCRQLDGGGRNWAVLKRKRKAQRFTFAEALSERHHHSIGLLHPAPSLRLLLERLYDPQVWSKAVCHRCPPVVGAQPRIQRQGRTLQVPSAVSTLSREDAVMLMVLGYRQARNSVRMSSLTIAPLDSVLA